MRHTFLKLTFLCALLCGAALEAWSMEVIVKREKEESLRFKDIKNDGTLRLQMEFGDVTFMVWDKDEILLESKTIVEAPNVELAEKGLKRHEFIHRKENDVYYISRQRVGNEENPNNVNYTSHCTLYIPKNKLSLQLSNKFGSIHMLDNYKCDRADISVIHGWLHINELLTSEAGKLSVKYGILNVSKANRLQIETEHCGKVELGTVKELTYKAQHGNIRIGEATTLHLDSEFCRVDMDTFNEGTFRMKFVTMSIQSARGLLALERCTHSTVICKSLAKGLKTTCDHTRLEATLTNAKAFDRFTVDGNLNIVNLRIPEDLKARYDLSAQFGKIHVDTDRARGTTEQGDNTNNFTTRCKGHFGRDAKAKPQISIHGQHNNVSVTE